MELCDRFQVDSHRALYLTGVENGCSDDDLSDIFVINGKISKIVRVPNEANHPEGRVLIEYESEQAILKINPDTLGELASYTDPTSKWSVRTIRDITQGELGKEMARRYLSELQVMGGSVQAGFLSFLQKEFQADYTPRTETQLPEEHNVNTTTHDTSGADPVKSVDPTSSSIPHSDTVRGSPHVDESIYNPPHVQKLVVEHIIRNEPVHTTPTQTKIRTFSGRSPRPNGEVDYETWRTQVDLLLSDPSLTDPHKVRKMLESLLSPAAEVVKPLGVTAAPKTYVAQLDSAFGAVEDGEELFTAFLGSNQDSGEKPSAFLNRLHSLLTKVVCRGGASAEKVNELLLKQFIRGCWDQSLIISLQLEAKKNNPPSFPELLLMLRTEEDRRSAKLDRMKRHLGATKAASHVHSIFDIPTFDQRCVTAPSSTSSETLKLENRVSELAKQVEKLSQKPKEKVQSSDSTVNMEAVRPKTAEMGKLESKIDKLTRQVEILAQSQKPSARMENPQHRGPRTDDTAHLRAKTKVPGMPRAWFCFKCGEDNHIAARCVNEPNPTLVHKKNAELKRKQSDFVAQQAATPFALN